MTGFARFLWLCFPPRARPDQCVRKNLDAGTEGAVGLYLTQFCPPSKKCPGCGADLERNYVPMVGPGVNGHGKCGKCLWAFRSHHIIDAPRAMGPGRIRVKFAVVLAFHPDEIHRSALRGRQR